MWTTTSFFFHILRLLAVGKRAPEQILALQQARLRRLLLSAVEHSPFYRRQFAGIDLRCCDLKDLPTMTKGEMMESFDEVVTDRRITRAGVERFLSDPENRGKLYLNRYAVCHTSGSQGQPAVVVQERSDILMAFAVEIARGKTGPVKPLALLAKHLRERARIAVVTQRPGFYPSGAVFAYLTEACLPFLRVLRLSIFDAVAETVARLNEFRPHFLIGYTSALEVLAREERAGHLRLGASGTLQQIGNVSEPLPPHVRETIEEVFGVHVADHYALGECLALSSGCPVSSGAHLNADLACLEVVDDACQPVPDGVAGSKVLVTNLYNFVQPLIRYQVGDVVTISPVPCPCGSPMAHIQSVAGRTKERLWIEEDGECRELPYYVFLAALHHCLEVAEHQVLQTGSNHFVVRVAPIPGKTVSSRRIKQLVYQSVTAEGLAGHFDLDVEIVNQIALDPRSGKLPRVRNLVGPPLQDRQQERSEKHIAAVKR
jgi:phenylacetate-coenzyme A ligase PaaK-like adenylate-forming protein